MFGTTNGLSQNAKMNYLIDEVTKYVNDLIDNLEV